MILGLILTLLIAVLLFVGIWLVLGAWGVAAFLVGLVGYIVLPIAYSLYEQSETLGRFYARTGFRYLGRSLLVARQAGYSLVRSQYNPEFDTENAVLDGDAEDWKDPKAAMSQLFGNPFGVTTDDIGMLVTPLYAEIGDRAEDLKSSGEWKRVIRKKTSDGDTTTETQMAKHVDLAREMVPVDIRDVKHFMAGSADPDSADTGEDYGEKSQEGYGEPFSAMQIGSWVLAFVVGAGVTWFVMSYGGDVGGTVDEVAGNETIPVFIEVMLG